MKCTPDYAVWRIANLCRLTHGSNFIREGGIEMNDYIIECGNFLQFTAICAWAIQGGYHFVADAEKYIVRFTGAF